MLRCLCCKTCRSRSSSESSVVEIFGEEPTGVIANQAVTRDEAAYETLRQEESEDAIHNEVWTKEGLPKEEQGLLPQQKYGNLPSVSDIPQEVDHLEKFKNESIRVGHKQIVNTGIPDAATGSSPPKFNPLAQEATIITPLLENSSLVDNDQLGPHKPDAAGIMKCPSKSQEIFQNNNYRKEEKNNLLTKTVIGLNSGIETNHETEQRTASRPTVEQVLVLGEDVTNITKTDQNFLKVRWTQDSEDQVKEVDGADERGHTTNNREVPGNQKSRSIHNDSTDSAYAPTRRPAEIKPGNETKIFQNGNQEVSCFRSDYDLHPACSGISCLYNQTGHLCAVAGERYVLTHHGKAAMLVRTHVTVREGAIVGCRLVWRGRVPVPLSELPDHTEVHFDAVVLPQTKMFHTVVIWQEVKPHLVIEPLPAAYIFIDSQVLSASRFLFQKETGYVEVNYDGKTVKSEFTKDVIFLNGKRASSSGIFMMSCFQPGRVFATVCKLMEGDSAGTVMYTCERVWSEGRPCADLLPIDFKRGEVYKKEPSGRYIREFKMHRLYCDVPATLKTRGQSCVLTFCIEKETISLPAKPEMLYFQNSKVVSPPSTDLSVKAHVVKFWGNCMWKVLMIQLLRPQKRIRAPYDSEIVLKVPTSAINNSFGPFQPQEGVDCGNISVRNISDTASVRGSLSAIEWVEGCVWNCASISQGIATHLNKYILIKQDRFYVDGVKVHPSEPLAKFSSKEILVNVAIQPQFSPINVLGSNVTHKAVVAWQGVKPQDTETFLKSNSEDPFTKLGSFDNRSIKKTFAVERHHNCPTPAADTRCYSLGMVNGVGNNLSPVQQSSNKFISYVGPCNWKRATISLGIITNLNSIIVVKPSTFFVNQVKILGNEPLVKFTFNGMAVNAVVVALSSGYPVLDLAATHEALVAWQGERPPEAENIIAKYYKRKPTGNQLSITFCRPGSRRNVLIKDVADSISSCRTATEGRVGDSLKTNVRGTLVKIGNNYGILKLLRCSLIKGLNTRVVFHPSVAYVDRKRLRSNKPLNQQLELPNSRLWHCLIQPYTAKIDKVTVQYKATLVWQGKRPTEKETLLQNSESPRCAASEAGTREDRRQSSVNVDKNKKPQATTSGVGRTTSTSSGGDVKLLEAGYVAKAATSSSNYVVTSEDSSSPDMFLAAAAMDERDIVQLDGTDWMSPSLYPTAAAGDERDIVQVDGSDWMSPSLFPTAAAGDERDIVQVDGSDWMSPSLFPVAAAGDERDIVQLG